MNVNRFAMLVGLALGAVWAFEGFDGFLITALLAAVGYIVGLVLEGRIDIDTGGLTGGPRRDQSRTM